MFDSFGFGGLAPDAAAADPIELNVALVQIQLRSRQRFGHCPDCGRQSRQVHSRYLCHPLDLPLGGRRVELTIMMRRFWCDAVLCGRRIFSEQFGKDVLARYGRRTERLKTISQHLGLALGGRPAAAFAFWLMISVHNDALMRGMRRRVSQTNDALCHRHRCLAFRRRQSHWYTIVSDLERRWPVTCRIAR